MDKKVLLGAVMVCGLAALAAGLRFYDLHQYPPGLFPDEAANGEDVQLILQGDWRPFYPRGNGREALFFYLQALSVKLFGIGVWPMHAVSATVGTLTVVAVYFATRVWFGRLAGFLAGFYLATSYWHVTMSRTGFRAIMIPLFVGTFTALVGSTVRAVKRGAYKLAYVYAALAGAALAGGFYTYIAYRVMVGVVLGVTVLVLLDDLFIGRSVRIMPHVKRYWKYVVVAAVAGSIVLVPLVWFFVQQPEAFVGRAGQVSIFSASLQQEYGGGTLLGTLLYSIRETLISFFAGEGDQNWRHSVPGFPLLNPLVGVLFLLGLAWTLHGTVVVLYSIVKGREVHLGMVYPYLLLVLLGMLVPVVTTAEGMPHGLRSIGLIVPIFMLAGTAGSVTIYWLKRKVVWRGARSAILGVIAGTVLVAGVYDTMAYFLISRNSAAGHYAYRGDLTVVSEYLNSYAAERGPYHEANPAPYIVLDKFSIQTVHFLTSVAAHDDVGDAPHPDEALHRWRQLDPATSHLTALEAGELMVFTQSTLADAERYQQYHKNIEVVEQRFNRFGEEIMRVYRGVTVPGTEDGQNQLDVPPSLDA